MSGPEGERREIPIETFERAWVAAGHKEALRLRVLELAGVSPLTLPAGLISGREDGPTATFIATQHGNEWNGIAGCHELFSRLDPGEMRGRVVLLPIANPLAFLEKRRTSSIDSSDMNRCYGSRSIRRPTEKIAHAILTEIIPRSNFVFDLHTGGPGEYLPCVAVMGRERLPLAFSLNLGCVFCGGKGRHRGGLIPAGEELGVPSFLVEMGRGRAIQQDRVGVFVEGALNFLRHVGILAGPAASREQPVFEHKVWVSSPRSGFFEPTVHLGQKVSEGQSVCRVTPLFSPKPVEVTSPQDGIIIYLRSEEMVSEKESLAHVAF